MKLTHWHRDTSPNFSFWLIRWELTDGQHEQNCIYVSFRAGAFYWEIDISLALWKLIPNIDKEIDDFNQKYSLDQIQQLQQDVQEYVNRHLELVAFQ
jgi:hypothetical protein